MPELVFFSGTMDCGKSTLALQIAHNRSARGLQGLIFTRDDRAGEGKLSSRLGLVTDAVEAVPGMDLYAHVQQQWAAGKPLDYLIVDAEEANDPAFAKQLAELADDVQVDVYCFGLATDFRGEMFPGSQRLFELADELKAIQVEVLCWCGVPGRFNARVRAGRMIRAGDTVLVADTVSDTEQHRSGTESNGVTDNTETTIRYQVLCRRHFRLGDLGPDVAQSGQLRLA